MGRLKTKIHIAIAICLLACNLLAQPRDVLERVFIQPNSQVFVSGETLRFSAFTLSHQTGKVTDLSKILYVQLIGKDGAVMEQKVALGEGRGSGEFFVNSLLPTGRYQLLAYTRWMRNFDEYFQLPITIINPFETELPEFQEDSTVQVKFYHPNRCLIVGVQNKVGFRVILPGGSPSIKAGKVLDAQGKVVQTFLPSENGLGHFDFTPKTGGRYRVLLENELGIISFHEFMPIDNEGYDVFSREEGDSLVLVPRAINRSPGELTMRLYFANSLWEDREVQPNEPQVFPLRTLPKDIFQVVLTESGRQVYTRSIVPPKESNQVKKIKGLKRTYGVRDSVKIQADLPAGEYSVSIHEKTNLLNALNVSAIQSRLWNELQDPLGFHTTPPVLSGDSDLLMSVQGYKEVRELPDSVLYLPEFREEIFSATLKETDGQPIPNVEVGLSFPGENYQFKTGFTNDNGKVVFQHRPLSLTQEAFLSVLDQEAVWQFEIEEKFLNEFPVFDYDLEAFDSLTAVAIKRRSIDNQIVNAFHKVPDSPALTQGTDLPFTQWDFEYTLDDYQRFPDFNEYFIEYIIGAGIKNGGINIRREYYRSDFQNRQLVLLDGVPVNAKRILQLDPYLVEKVSVLMNRAYLGPSVFDGVVLIETYDNDLAGFELTSSQKFDYKGISPLSGSFSGPAIMSNHQPDRRIQIYWEPLLDWPGGLFHLNSLTSDVSSVFEIRIEGFSSSGEPVSISSEFEVKR